MFLLQPGRLDFIVTPIIGFTPRSCTTTWLWFISGDVQTSLGGKGIKLKTTPLGAQRPMADPPTGFTQQQRQTPELSCMLE